MLVTFFHRLVQVVEQLKILREAQAKSQRELARANVSSTIGKDKRWYALQEAFGCCMRKGWRHTQEGRGHTHCGSWRWIVRRTPALIPRG